MARAGIKVSRNVNDRCIIIGTHKARTNNEIMYNYSSTVVAKVGVEQCRRYTRVRVGIKYDVAFDRACLVGSRLIRTEQS